jgi:hypothetical protein
MFVKYIKIVHINHTVFLSDKSVFSIYYREICVNCSTVGTVVFFYIDNDATTNHVQYCQCLQLNTCHETMV